MNAEQENYMRGSRLRITLRLWMIRSSFKRADYFKRCHVFAQIGEGCSKKNVHYPYTLILLKQGTTYI